MFADRWDSVIGDSFSSSLIRHGVVPDLGGTVPLPPRFPRRRPPPASPTAMQRSQAELVRKLHEQRVIEALAEGVPPPDSSPCGAPLRAPGVVHPWFSTYFLVPKPTPGAFRGILDLRGPNEYIPDEHFKQETLRTVKETVREGDYMTSCDISSAYPHLLVAPRFRNLLCFRTDCAVPISPPSSTDPECWDTAATAVGCTPMQVRDFRFRSLPFGLKSAPRLWTRFLRPVISALRSGRLRRPDGSLVPPIRLVCYLDDILIMNPTREGCHRDTVTVVNLLRSLGLLLAEDKCETVPTQQIEFLGLVCSTTDMMFYVPSKKRRNFVADTRRLLQLARHRHIQLRQLAGWIGKARALGDAVVHSRRRTRSCLRCLNGALASGARWGHFVRLQRPALAELQWWLHTAEAWKGSGIMIPTHDVSIDTDAGPWAWGGFLGQQSAGGFWSRRQLSRLSQNHKELLGVFFTLQAFEEQLVGKTVLVQTDNKSVISYLMKGGGRSESLSLKAEEVFDWCQRRQIRLRCVHLRGVLNVRADRVSRLYESRSEYQLRPACFRQLQRLHGPMDVDLFAARHNHLLPRYFSLLRDSAAVGQDAFQQDWSRLRHPFANPPYALISRVLRQARRQRVPRFTLIAPDWGAPWAPDLREMALAPPTLLPDTVTAPLLQPSLPTPWPAHPPRWKTYAWLLSGSF
ncbi:reverse transcriptase domain-containing protein [bacterium]|nr:reverse transcriptase domain-containing protein [bacterium]